MVRSVIVSGFGERWGVGSHDGKMCLLPFFFPQERWGDGGKEKLNGGRCDCDFVIFFGFFLLGSDSRT